MEYEALLEEPHEEGEGQVQDEWEREGEPPADVLLGVGCGYTHETAYVDEEVEQRHDALGGGLGVLDDTLAFLGGDYLWHSGGHLIEQHGGDVWLEHSCVMSASVQVLGASSCFLTGTDGKHVQGDEVGDFGVATGQQALVRAHNHQSVSDTEDADTIADELEATSPSVGQPSKEDGKNVDERVERLANSIGLDSTHAESTSGLLIALRRRTPAVTAPRQRTVDVVADELLDSVVGRALSELDEADEVGDHGHGACNTA